MDIVTHALMGAVTAQLGFRQRIGRDAMWVATAAAVAPDLDILVPPLMAVFGVQVNGDDRFIVHRGVSHSLLAVPVIALAIAAAWWWLRRRRLRRIPCGGSEEGLCGGSEEGLRGGSEFTRPGGHPPREATPAPAAGAPFWLLYACTLVAAATHPFLDWCTAYGTELFAPITATRYAANIVAVVDIFYTALLVLALVACWLVRRVRGGRAVGATLAVGWIAFLLAVGYLVGGYLLGQRVAGEARALAGTERVVRIDAYPALGSIFVWRAVVRTDDGWITARVRPLGGSVQGVERAGEAEGPWVERARELPEVRRYEWFAMGRVRAACEDKPGRHVVEFQDMRYGARPESIESLWPLTVTFDGAGNVVAIERTRRVRADWFQMIREAWQDIWTRGRPARART